MQNRGQNTPTENGQRPMTEWEQMAQKIYDGNKADPGLWMDGSRLVVSEGVVREWEQEAWSKVGDQATVLTQRFRKNAVDLAKAVGDDTGARLLRHQMKAEIAEVRRTGEKPDKEARAAALRDNGEESRRRLQRTFGADRAPDILARVRKFIRNTPAVSRVLASHDLTEQPDVIEELAAFVYGTNYR
jgi:hypothetical protein